jgi:lysophospholipase L1-like esterase
MLQRILPHLKLGILGSKTIGASSFPDAGGGGSAAAGGSCFEQATEKAMRARAAKIVVVFIGVLALACEPRPPQGKPAAASSPARYLAIGDSFTIGTGSSPNEAFPARLVERWRSRGCAVELKNVAVDGYTTADVIREELPAIASFRPTFLTVAVGANDIVQGRSEDEYRANLRRIFSEAARAARGHVVVVALPQPDWSQSPIASTFGDRAAIAKRIRRYDAIFAEEAIASGAIFIDARPEPGAVASDGLHPSASAHAAWAEAIATARGATGACPSSP